MRNVFGDQGNMERNFWEQGNSVKVNFGEHLNLFLRNKGTTVNFHREQGSWLQNSSYAMRVFSQYKSTHQISNETVLDESIAGVTKVYSFHTHY